MSTPLPVLGAVEQWTKKIKDARKYWEPDFCRMRENMEFAAGFQWNGQVKLDDDKYIANLTNRAVNQKVATLYAKNPKFKANPTERLYFQVWDGKVETLQQAAAMLQAPEADPATQFQANVLMADYTQGHLQKAMVERVGKTLDIVFKWNLNNQMPSFKLQMKQMVRTAVTCGVGYVKLDYARGPEGTLSSTDTESTTKQRLDAAHEILGRVSRGELPEDSPEIVKATALLQSLNEQQAGEEAVQERLVFDFPSPTSIIVDPNCVALKGFVGAKWMAEEHYMPLEDINAHFGLQIKMEDGVEVYDESGGKYDENQPVQKAEKKGLCCLWCVYELATKSYFYILDGYKTFVAPPEPCDPCTKHFWPVFALTFNDVTVEPGKQKASIYPPSDVQLIKSAQKEWNRTKDSLREHRKANEPCMAVAKGQLTDDDKKSILNRAPNAIIELQNLQPNEDVNKRIQVIQHPAVDPTLYDTAPLQQDMLAVLGNENATQPASNDYTATAATINEQSRLVVTSSNVDDLDDLLTDLAEAGGEIIFLAFSPETVQQIAGVGAVWPGPQEVSDFVNYISLEVVAASSGRPNRALELANWGQIAPILQMAGASPWFMIRETLKRLDDPLDPSEAFSLGPTATMPQESMAQAQSMQPARGQQAPGKQNLNPAATVPRIQQPNV